MTDEIERTLERVSELRREFAKLSNRWGHLAILTWLPGVRPSLTLTYPPDHLRQICRLRLPNLIGDPAETWRQGYVEGRGTFDSDDPLPPALRDFQAAARRAERTFPELRHCAAPFVVDVDDRDDHVIMEYPTAVWVAWLFRCANQLQPAEYVNDVFGFSELACDAFASLIQRRAATPRATRNSSTASRRRGTERGGAEAKLIAALTKHHEYADGGSLNPEPIGNNELARMADVDKATASAFFKTQFKGHAKYKIACNDAGLLAAALKMLNREFAVHSLYGSAPDEVQHDDQ